MLFVNKNGSRTPTTIQTADPNKWRRRDYICVKRKLFKGKTLGMLTRRVWVWRGCNSSHRKLPHISANSFRRKKKTSILWLRRSLSFPRVARVSFIVSVRDTGPLETTRIIITQRFIWEVCLDLKCYNLLMYKIHERSSTCKKQAQK